MPSNVALLGTGLFAKMAYLPALKSSSDAVFKAVWSRSASSVDKFISEAGVDNLQGFSGTEGFEKILANGDIQSVMIALPITSQPDLIIKSLEAGKHVMSEKPVAKDKATAIALIERYEKEFKPKGLIWRVAENFAHEPLFLEAGKLLKESELGPVLYWMLQAENSFSEGNAWLATEWRNVPDYQGGFILDGGVHSAALLRVMLPQLPARFISSAALHRSILAPLDTVTAIALPPKDSYVEAHGKQTNDVSRIPGGVGKSGTTGTIVLAWSKPDVPKDPSEPDFTLDVRCLNGTLRLTSHYALGKLVLGIKGVKGSGVKDEERESSISGVSEEVDQFARAAAGVASADEVNRGEPRASLWDLQVIEALLWSDGQEVTVPEPSYQ